MVNENTIIALVAGIGGGALAKAIDFGLARLNRREDLAVDMRQELREQVRENRERVDRLEQELALWKDRYYQLVEEHGQLKVDHIALTHELDMLREKVRLLEERDG